MLESFLREGRQDLDPTRELTHGQSITDACLGWETTEKVLETCGTRRSPGGDSRFICS